MECTTKPKSVAVMLGNAVSAVLMAVCVYRLIFLGIDGLRVTAVLVFAACLVLFAATCVAVKNAEDANGKRAAVRRSLMMLFLFYLLSLVALLFVFRIDPAVSYAERRAFYEINWETQTNFVPFDTVRRYVDAFSRGVIPRTSMLNLAGNIILMAPMAFFLPTLFPSMRKLWRFLIITLCILVAIEAIQLLLCCGICDIDDVILNWAGAMIIYLLLSLPPIAKLLARLYIWQPARSKGGAVRRAEITSSPDAYAKPAEPIVGIDIVGNIGIPALKTGVSVFLCLLLGHLIKRESTCLYASLSAILCLCAGGDDSLRTHFSRLFGAVLGGVLGCALVVAGRNIPGYEERFFIIVLPCALLFAVYLLNVLRLSGGAAITCAAILLIGLQVGGSEGQGVHFAIRRALEMLTGAGVAFLSSVLLPPYTHGKGPQPPRT